MGFVGGRDFAHCLIRRRSVSSLTGKPKRLLSRSPGRPPRAYAICCTTSPKRLVSRACLWLTRVKRWQKICRSQSALRQRQRPTRSFKWTGRPVRGGLSNASCSCYDARLTTLRNLGRRRSPGRQPRPPSRARPSPHGRALKRLDPAAAPYHSKCSPYFHASNRVKRRRLLPKVYPVEITPLKSNVELTCSRLGHSKKVLEHASSP